MLLSKWVLCFVIQPFAKYIAFIKLPALSSKYIRLQHFINSQILPKSYSLATFRQTAFTKFRQNHRFRQLFQGPSSRVNIFARNISSTALTKFGQNRQFRQIRRFRQIRQLFRGPSSRVNIFVRNISSTALTKFGQNRQFRQIRRFRQIRQLFQGPSSRVNIFAKIRQALLLQTKSCKRKIIFNFLGS